MQITRLSENTSSSIDKMLIWKRPTHNSVEFSKDVAYREQPSVQNLPIVQKVVEQVICLPLYADLLEEKIRRVVNVVEQKEV